MEAILGTKVAQQLRSNKIAVASEDAVEALKTHARMVKEENILLDIIRVFQVDDGVIVQEKSRLDQRIILRLVESVEAAQGFIQLRDDQVAKLWEVGCCGGRRLINYDEPFVYRPDQQNDLCSSPNVSAPQS
mmetsp:Transcript_19719/g.27500  ORF Transcript_19719/g.27500 Transcript_19719/m.27500 type:complete len:132 (-) Transcript_19719:87-482(-)|eukprot:CAMPEP_0168551186 /NCGR_PEP_ID=MMETSP0413-20121227/6034_1 /TAXON_ID=136452 /ORGANISM="Filamoeba nolandi, Strain NC-AS-23-1" /LENGTH=131 /DNA_ID=CAMNT_0008581687 /DNA_START=1112 /DNA_END=1507 /DNA_ORIENTATION=+